MPTLPLSGGKLNTVTAILFSNFVFFDSLQQGNIVQGTLTASIYAWLQMLPRYGPEGQ